MKSLGIILTAKATFVQNFVSFMASIAELAHGEKLHTQSLNQLHSLCDVPETEAFALEYLRKISKLSLSSSKSILTLS